MISPTPHSKEFDICFLPIVTNLQVLSSISSFNIVLQSAYMEVGTVLGAGETDGYSRQVPAIGRFTIGMGREGRVLG